MGVTVLPTFDLVFHRTITYWLEDSSVVDVNYLDFTEEILTNLILDYTQKRIPKETFGKIAFDPKFYRYFL
jgi:hypothetical protein